MDWNAYVKLACLVFIITGLACLAVGGLLNYFRRPGGKRRHRRSFPGRR